MNEVFHPAPLACLIERRRALMEAQDAFDAEAANVVEKLGERQLIDLLTQWVVVLSAAA
jgi:hypothetical protein